MALPPPKRTGTGFTNVQKYLQANRPGQLGQNISSRLQGEAEGIQTGLGKASDAFKSEVESNRLDTEANKRQRQNVLGQVNELKDPNEVQSKIQQKDVEDFGKFRAGEYKGPQEIKDSQTFLGQSQEIGDLGKGLGTQAGRFNLLNRYLGGTGYSTGEKRFDNLLLGNAPGLNQARRQALQSGKQVEGQIGIARNMAQEAAAKNKAFGQETQQNLTGLETDINTNIGNRLKKHLLDKPELYKQYETALKNRDLTGTNLQDLAGTQLFGVDPLKYLQQSADPTKQNVASMDERAKLQALYQLSGKPTTDLSFAPDVYDPSKAVTLDKDLLMADIARGKERYEQEVNRPLFNLNTSGGFTSLVPYTDPTVGQVYGFTPGSLQEQVNYLESADPFMFDPSRYNAANANIAKRDSLMKYLNKIRTDYGYNDTLNTKKEVK